MNKDDILRLGRLSRIRIAEDEIDALCTDIDAVIEYVSVVNDITAETGAAKRVGVVYNVFREDEVTVEPGSHTEALLAEAPKVKGRHLEVKKILTTD